MANPVVCPKCGSADELREQAFRYTFQRVHGLTDDGGVREYDSFDYTDEVIVTGYSCECGWFDADDVQKRETDRLAKYAERVLATMKPKGGTNAPD